MRKILFTVIFVFILTNLHSQSLGWRAQLFGFADNREYDASVQIPQSILGVQLAPEIYLNFDSIHTLNVGLNALKEFGSTSQFDKINPYIYYGMESNAFSFNFGVFPRKQHLGSAPKAIYYDSLYYYRPYISGLFWTYSKGTFNQSVYLDWTSRQTNINRETFIMGGKGEFSYKMFYFENHIYMYHHAGTAIPQEGDHLRDNGVVLLTLGINASNYIFFDTLKLSFSGIKSFERERNVSGWHSPNGVIVDFSIDYKGLGILNSFYYGQGHNLDWGDPFYRLKQYNRTDVYYKMLNFKKVSGAFTYSFHFAEGNVSHQQQFIISVDLSSDFKSPR